MNKTLPSLALLAFLVGCATPTHPEYQTGDSPRQSRSSAEQVHAARISQMSVPGYDAPPHAISTHFPEYPQEWRNQGIAGSVVTTFTIGTDGKVTNPSVLGSPPPELAAIVLHAIMKWKFKPAIKNGAPVAVQAQQAFNFKVE